MMTVNWSEVDEAIKVGDSSMQIWSKVGRNLGLTLEDVVMRRQRLRGTRRPSWQRSELPLFRKQVGTSSRLARR